MICRAIALPLQYCILKIQTDRIFKSMRKNNHVEVTISPEANDELFNYCLKGLPQGEGGRGIGNSVEKYLIKRGRCRFVPSATTPSALPAPSVQPRGEHVRGLGRRDAIIGVRAARAVCAFQSSSVWTRPTPVGTPRGSSQRGIMACGLWAKCPRPLRWDANYGVHQRHGRRGRKLWRPCGATPSRPCPANTIHL